MRWWWFWFLVACDPSPAFVRLAEARQLAVTVEAELARSADAATRVVLRDASARASVVGERAALGRDLARLTPLLRDFEPESTLLTRLQGELAQDAKLEAALLTLTGEGSNVHALALAIGDKRAAHEACARTLRELSERLQACTFPATR